MQDNPYNEIMHDMNCKDEFQCDHAWDLLSVYCDGEASPLEQSIIEQHLAVCANCTEDLRMLKVTSFTVSILEEVQPPAFLREAILTSTVFKPSFSQRVAAAIQHALKPIPVRSTALAGAAGLLLAVFLHNGTRSTMNSPSPLIAMDVKPQSVATAPRAEILGSPDYSVPNTSIPNLSGDRAVKKVREGLIRVSDTKTGNQFLVPLGVVTKVKGTTPRVSAVKAMGVPEIKSKQANVQDPVEDEWVAEPPADNIPATSSNMATADMIVKVPDMDMLKGMSGAEESAAAPAYTHYTLTADVTTDTSGPASSLAELKRTLRNRNIDDIRAIEKSIKAREIRLPVFRRAF